MKISTKGRYALRMLIYLAQKKDSGFIALKEIAENQGVSKKYLEQIVPTLNNAGYLITGRGYQGGYKLAKKPEDYTVGDILRLTEGNLAPVTCLEVTPNQCERSNSCAVLPVWKGLHKVINEYLDGITLSDIVKNQEEIDINSYEI